MQIIVESRIKYIFSWFVIISVFCPLVFANEDDNEPVVSFRELYGDELSEAQKASDYAEKLRNNFKSRFPWGADEAYQPSSSEAKQDFDEVVKTYKVVISGYPGTEIAADCAIRLGGLYKYRRDYDQAIVTLKEAADQYAGTPVENKIFFSLGLMHLQSKNNPEEAANWFKLIPKPSPDNSVEPDSYNEGEKYYLSAQQQTAVCELKLNKAAYAKRRYERLKERYPGFQSEIEDELRKVTITDLESKIGSDLMESVEDTIAPDTALSESQVTTRRSSYTPEQSKSLVINESTKRGNVESATEQKNTVKSDLDKPKVEIRNAANKSKKYLSILLIVGGVLLVLISACQCFKNSKERKGK